MRVAIDLPEDVFNALIRKQGTVKEIVEKIVIEAAKGNNGWMKAHIEAEKEALRRKIHKLEKEKEKARQVYLEYEAKLAQLEKEKERIIQEFIAMGEREKEKIIEMAKKTAEQIKESAKKAAEQEVKSVKEQLRAEVAEIAAELAEEVIKKNFTPQDQKKIVEEYLTKLS